MILGTEARVRPLVELVERGTGIDLSEGQGSPSPGPRDRGNFLSPRLYPTAPFDPWQAVLSYVTPAVGSDEETYEVASESM
jgi:hypothetical protein